MATTDLKHRSPHDLSHSRRLTYPMGRVTPSYLRVLAPGEKVNINATDIYRLDPFAYPVMDTVQATHAWYAVPLHQLFEGFERFITGSVTDAATIFQDGIHKSYLDTLPWMPYINPLHTSSSARIVDDVNTLASWEQWSSGNGAVTSGGIDNAWREDIPIGSVEPQAFLRGYASLWDPGVGLLNHLGVSSPACLNGAGTAGAKLTSSFRLAGNINLSQVQRLSALPFLAYHKIIDDWFRDEEMEYPSLDWPLDIMKHYPIKEIIGGSLSTTEDVGSRYRYPICSSGMLNPGYWSSIRAPRFDTPDSVDYPTSFANDSGWRTRRANWAPDLFNTRRPAPQRGEGEDIVIGADGLFSIDELREATAVQNFRLSQQRSGGRLDDYYRKQFGITDSSCHFGKCDYITHETTGLEISDVLQTSGTPQADGYTSTPQGNPVAYSKTVSRSGGVSYMAKCHCILMRLSYVAPNPSYHAYVDPSFLQLSRYDFFTPQLEAIGWQPIPRVMVFPVTRYSGTATDTPTINITAYPGHIQSSHPVTGWQPPYETYRRQVSFNTGSFNPINDDAPFDNFTFGRDFSRGDISFTGSVYGEATGNISSVWRKCDPTNRPFAVESESPTQVQHFAYFDVRSVSPVPHAINNRCLTH